MFAPAETDDDATRAEAASVALDRILADRLRPLAKPGCFDRAFLDRDPASYDAADRRLLHSIAWHYRHQLPRHLRPTVNPDDRLVRERDQRHG